MKTTRSETNMPDKETADYTLQKKRKLRLSYRNYPA